MLKKTYCPCQPDSVPGDWDLDQGLRCGCGCSTLGVCWPDFLCWNECIFKTGDYMFLALHFFFPSQVCINMPKQDAELAQTDLFKPGNMSTWTQLLALSQCKSAPSARALGCSHARGKAWALAISIFISVWIVDIDYKKGLWWVICMVIHDKKSDLMRIYYGCGRSFSTQKNLC